MKKRSFHKIPPIRGEAASKGSVLSSWTGFNKKGFHQLSAVEERVGVGIVRGIL